METCTKCQKAIETPTDGCTTGYGKDRDGNVVCYACCAEADKQAMRDDGRITLYLTFGEKVGTLTNWPGSLSIEVSSFTKGRHNIARVRYDVWFTFEGRMWHGVQYGDNTQLCHCRRNKAS